MMDPRLPVFRLTSHDRITLEDVAYRPVCQVAAGYVLARVDDPLVMAEFTHERLRALSQKPGFRFDRAAFDPAALASRLESEARIVSELPPKDRECVLWRQFFCVGFMKLEADGKASRSDASMKRAIGVLSAEFTANEGRWVGRRNEDGKQIPLCAGDQQPPTPPSPRTLRTWLKAYEEAGLRAVALRKKLFRCGNRVTVRHPPEIRGLLADAALNYASNKRPSVADLHRKLKADIDLLNLERERAGLSPLKKPSYDRLLKEVRSIPAFDVYAGRYDQSAAMKKFAMVANGPDVERPLQRVEIDEWKIDLHTLVEGRGVLEGLTPEQQDEIRRTRFWACVAIDFRTRVILGMKVAPRVSSSLAREVLEMVVTPKAAFADAAGARSPWDQHGSPEAVVTDQGSTFMSRDFRRAVIDLGCDADAPPAGMPGLRGTIERFFHTIDQQALGIFTGRSFGNVVEKGGYDAVAQASLSIEELCTALVRWVVDVYHNCSHAGLGGETPANAWSRLTGQFGIIPPPDRHVRRAIFGLDLQRTMSSRGVVAMGLFYNAYELQEHRRRHGDVEVDIKVDPADLGHISVRLGEGGWIAVPCMRPGLDDVPISIWQAAAADMRRRFIAEAKVNDAVVSEAIRDAWEMARKAERRAGILSTRPSAEELAKVERQIGLGFLSSRHDGPPIAPSGKQADLMARATPTSRPAPNPPLAAKPSRIIKPRN